MLTYKYTVPTTAEMESFSGICGNYLRYNRPTYRQNALACYNLFRGDKGLPPLNRMPNGTVYSPIYDYDIEGHFGQGWEIVCCESNRKDALVTIKEYRENSPGLYRIKKRPAKP